MARTVRRRTVLALAVALAVLAGGGTLATWATDTGPFEKRSYCWGALREESGPRVLRADEEPVTTESGSLQRGQQATCTVAFGTPGASQNDSGTTAMRVGGQKVTVRVGPPPRPAAERRSWLEASLHGSAAPLPEGLPGVVGRDRGTLVLPGKCDDGGLPTTVTVRAEGEVWEIGSEREVADMLLSLAGTAREELGCAEGKPSRITAPVHLSGTEQATIGNKHRPACRLPGMRFTGGSKESGYGVHKDTVADHLQVCSFERVPSRGHPTQAGQFIMTSQPRLVALFDGLAGDTPPGKEWRGKGTIRDGRALVTAECRGGPTVFYLNLDDRLAKTAIPDTRHVFARSVNSVAERLGCEAVAPRV